MTKREKRLQKLRQNPKNVSFDDLRKVLDDYGFELVRSSGSHHSFNITIASEPRLLVIPYSRPVKAVYVQVALSLIELLEQELEDGEGSEDDE
jgi:predicted RNA binding protein YcfA (HicA-like mRNA interferase family)